MITIRKFRFAVALLPTCFIGAIFCHILFRHSLPPELQAYKHNVATDHANGPMFLWSLGFVIIYLLASTISVLGLYFFRPFARPLFVLCLVTGFVSILFYGPRVENRSVAWFEDVDTLLSGIVLALIYWSPIREHFTKQKPTT